MLKVENGNLYRNPILEQYSPINFCGNIYYSLCSEIEQWMIDNDLDSISSDDQKMVFKLMFPKSDWYKSKITMDAAVYYCPYIPFDKND